MSTDVLLYIAAFAGGFVAAAFGALVAFVFTGLVLLVGIAVLIATGDGSFISLIAFGPFFGPHISFAGGVGAAAFAARKGWLDNGKDIVTPLASLGKPVVLLVGGVFGVIGLVIQQVLSLVPWFGTHTDAVACTVIVSGLLARLVFGRSGIIGAHSEGLTGAAKFRPTEVHVWASYQEKWSVAATLGLGAGLLAAWAAVSLASAFPKAPSASLVGFGVSAFSLGFLALGLKMPITHHMTIIGAVGATSFLPITQSPLAAILIGTGFAILSALLAEAFARFWYIRGDTHMDPPASAIWPMTTLVLGLAAAFG